MIKNGLLSVVLVHKIKDAFKLPAGQFQLGTNSLVLCTFFLLKDGIPHIKIQPSSRNGQDGSENMIV